MILSLNLPFTWYISPFIITACLIDLPFFQAGTIEDVKTKADQLAKEMGN